MAELEDAAYLNDGCITAQGDRQVLNSLVCSEGIVYGHGDGLQVVQDSPASMDVIVGSGNAFIEGTQVAWQGMYQVSNDADVTLTVGAADPTDDRIDLVVARVYDPTYGDPDQPWALEVVAGTPSPAPAPPTLPDNSLLLATIAVGAGVTTITTGDITDERVRYELCGTGPIETIVYTSNDTFTASDYPTLAFIEVEVQGSGGGGGGGFNPISFGGGGGSGGYCKALLYPADLGTPQAITVAAGGAGGIGANDGSNGGTSSFGALISCAGGQGGATDGGNEVAQGGSSGAVVTSVTDAIQIAGQAGEPGWYVPHTGNNLIRSGSGANSPLGLGGQGRTYYDSGLLDADGRDGTGYGSGGGGALEDTSLTSATGGAGADGVVIVRVYG